MVFELPLNVITNSIINSKQETMKITFNKKDSGLVLARVRVGDGKQFNTSTRIKSSRKVNLRNGRFVGDKAEAAKLNKELVEFENELMDKMESAKRYGLGNTTGRFKEFLKSGDDTEHGDEFTLSNVLKGYKALLNSGSLTHRVTREPLSPVTITNENSNLDKLITMPPDITSFDFGLYNSFTKRDVGNITVESQFEVLYFKIYKWLCDEDYNHSTIGSFINTFKKAVKVYLKQHGIEVGELLRETFKVTQTKYEVLTISFEQSQYIVNNYHKIRDEICTPKQKVALMYWITALLLVPRSGDMQNWTRDNIREVDGIMTIKYRSSKTDTLINSEVPANLVPIFRKNLMECGKPLPPMGNLSTKIKEIAKRIDLFGNKVTIERKKGGKKDIIVRYEWEVLKLHMMRASGITNLIALGVPDPVIKSLSGHTENSADYGKYQNITTAISSPAIKIYEDALQDKAAS